MKRNLTISLLFFFAFSVSGQKPKLIIPVGHTNMVTTLALNASEEIVAASDGSSQIKLWSVETRKELYSLSGHLEAVNALTFHPTANFLASASNDKSIIVWDLKKAQKRTVLTGHTDAVSKIEYSKEGTELISSSADGTIKVWDVNSGTLSHEIKIGVPVHCFDISHGEDYIAIGTRSGAIFIADFKSGQIVHELSPSAMTVNDVKFTPDGQKVISADNLGKLYVHNSTSGELIQTIPAFSLRARQIEFLSGADRIVTIGRDARKNIRFFDIITGEELNKEMEISSNNHPNFSLGLFALAINKSNSHMMVGDYDGSLSWHNIEEGTRQAFSGKAKAIHSIDIDVSDKWLAIASERNEVTLLDLTGFSDAKLIASHSKPIKAVAFHPTKDLFVTSGSDKINEWKTTDWSLSNSFETSGEYPETPLLFNSATNSFFKKDSPEGVEQYHADGKRNRIKLKDVFDFRISPNGDRIYGRVSNKSIETFDTKKFKRVAKLEFSELKYFDLSQDGKTIAAVEGRTLQIIDISSGITKSTISFPDEVTANRIIFVAGTSLVATWNTTRAKFGSEDDYTIKIWDIPKGKLTSTLTGHTGLVTSISFLKNEFIFSSSLDGTIRIWSLKENDESAYKASLTPLDGSNWAVTTTIGVFDATNSAMAGMHYVQGSEIIQLDQLKDRYFEPHLLSKILGYNDEPIRAAEELDELSLYPEIDLLHPDLNGGRLGIELSDQGGGIGRVIILINDKEISSDVRDASMVGKNSETISLSYGVLEHPFIKAADLNKVSIRAYNKNGDLVSRTKNLYLLPSSNEVKKQPEFYAVIAGVSNYQGNELDLKFAAKDATDIAEAIKLSATQYLGAEHVHINLLTTDNSDSELRPTKRNIIKALDEIAKKADANDVLFIYLAGHGVNYGGEQGDFYYLTEDAKNGILADPQIRESVSISSGEFTEAIRKISSVKQVLILDACHSGKLASDLVKRRSMSSYEVRALETMKDRTGLYVLAGSAADALSYESSQYGQGLLTYSLLFGLKGPALRQNEYVDILKLFQFATEKVPELAADIGGIQKPEIRIPTESTSFDIGKLSEAGRSQINVSTPKPVLVRSEFQDEILFMDVLELGSKLDELVKNSTKDAAAELVFVDSRRFDNAYTVRGRYTQNENQIFAKIKLFRDKLVIAEFELSANSAADLSQMILKEVSTRISY